LVIPKWIAQSTKYEKNCDYIIRQRKTKGAEKTKRGKKTASKRGRQKKKKIPPKIGVCKGAKCSGKRGKKPSPFVV